MQSLMVVLNKRRLANTLLILVVGYGLIKSFELVFRGWVGDASRGIFYWVLSPEIVFRPAGLPEIFGLALLAYFVVLGVSASFVLMRTCFPAEDFGPPISPLSVALGSLLGPAIAGQIAIIGQVLGLYSLRFLIVWILVVSLLILSISVNLLLRDQRSKPSVIIGGFGRGSLVFVLGMSVLIAHIVQTPIVEPDALTYHALVAKLWASYDGSAPLLFGPSVGPLISANYPPLFPAILSVLLKVSGSDADMVIKSLAPLHNFATAVMIYIFSAKFFDKTTAWLALAVFASIPMISIYSFVPSNYPLLSLEFLTAVYLILLWRSRLSAAGLVPISIVFGMLISTNFLGFLAVLGLAAFLLYASIKDGVSRRGILWRVVLASTIIALISGPWMIRNYALLGDPFFPFGNGVFGIAGFDQSVWELSKAQIRNNALGALQISAELGHWPMAARSLFQFLQPSADSWWIPMGSFAALLGGTLAYFERNDAGKFLAAVIASGIFYILAIGWYFPRHLYILAPAVSILTASSFRRFWRICLFAIPSLVPLRVAVSILAVLCVVIVASPGIVLMTTGSPIGSQWLPRFDAMWGVKNLGDHSARIRRFFGGNQNAIEWLNQRQAKGDRIATLETAVMRIQNSENLLFLDGPDASQLIGESDPLRLKRFFQERNVSYIYIPSWAWFSSPAKHPIVDKMPLFDYLGGPDFPVLAGFQRNLGTEGFHSFSVIFGAGSAAASEPGYFIEYAHGSEPVTDAIIPPQVTSWRVFLYPIFFDEVYITVRFLDRGTGTAHFNYLDYGTGKWLHNQAKLERTDSGKWTTTILQIPARAQEIVEYGLWVEGEPLNICLVGVDISKVAAMANHKGAKCASE